jgi:V/A-type H+-transporting ATPase subunit I
MTKVHIIGHRRKLDATLSTLQQMGVVHLIDVTKDTTLRLPPMSIDPPHVKELDDARFLKAKLDGYLRLLDQQPAEDPSVQMDTIALRHDVETVGSVIEDRVHHLDALRSEKDTLPRHLDSLRRLLPLIPRLPSLTTYDTVAIVIDARYEGALGDLNVQLTEMLGGNFAIISDQVDPTTLGAVVVFPRTSRAEVEKVLGGSHVERLRLPHRYETVPFEQAIADMESRLETIDNDIADTKAEIEDLIRPHADWVTASHELDLRCRRLAAIRSLGATPHTFVVSGWVPDGRIGELEASLRSTVGHDVLVEIAPLGRDEQPPVQLANAPLARPFQPLVRLLALPRYGTLDPTTLMSVVLPFFFGMMVGDVAYGSIITIAAAVIAHRSRARAPTVADFGRVFVLSGLWAVAWGFAYGEFLGDLGARWFGLRPLLLNREEALVPLLVFALAVGGAHVMLGLALGVWQARRGRDRHQMLEHLGNIVALIGLFGLAGVATGLLPHGFATPAIAAVVVGLVVLMVLGGPLGILLGPLELMGTIGNVLSYLRLAAIGLASVYLARVANELGAAAPLWLGIIVAALFHALNLALGTFSPTIQALRLHYVEFFQKFYAEGGDPYSPFGAEPSRPLRSEQLAGVTSGKE